MAGDKEFKEFAIEILKKYAYHNGTIVRSISDLSPLEEYLIYLLYIENQKTSNMINLQNE